MENKDHPLRMRIEPSIAAWFNQVAEDHKLRGASQLYRAAMLDFMAKHGADLRALKLSNSWWTRQVLEDLEAATEKDPQAQPQT